ncbi:MAG: hypothetical protein WDO73_35840 [Ignavibacteriota bacterium]
MRTQGQIAVGMHEWKVDDDSTLSGNGTLRNGTVSDLVTLLELKNIPVVGAAAGTAQISGTWGDPHISTDFQLSRGTLYDEPFDRFNGHMNYNAAFIEVTGGQISAGNGLASVSAAYRHGIGQFDTGHLQMRVSTNARLLEQVKTIQKEYPGLKGTVTIAADGEADISPPRAGSDILTLHITALHADVLGRGLQLSDQVLGETHLTASSQGDVLRAHLESTAASSQLRGDGEWKLEGDSPGSATITFAKLDLVRLRTWLEPGAVATPGTFSGSAEGQLRIDGPLTQPQALKAQLTIPRFEIGPPEGSDLPMTGKFVLRNAGPSWPAWRTRLSR